MCDLCGTYPMLTQISDIGSHPSLGYRYAQFTLHLNGAIFKMLIKEL